MRIVLAVLFAPALLCLAASPALAGDTMKDPSSAFACQKNGKLLSVYRPYGRAPTMSERAQCRRLGGRIQTPARSRQAGAHPRR